MHVGLSTKVYDILANSLLENSGASNGTDVFTLCRVASLDIAQRRVRLDDTSANQIVQAQEILVVTQAVQISPTERQSAKVLGNGVEQRLCRRDTEGDFGSIGSLGVM